MGRVNDCQTLVYWLIQGAKETGNEDMTITQLADIAEWCIDKGVVFPAPYPCNDQLREEIQQYVDDRTIDEL